MTQLTCPKTGITWTLIDRQPYVRKTDGKPSELLTWSAVCVKKGCGKTIVRVTGKDPLKYGWGRKHCDDHKAAPFFKRKNDVSDLV